MGTVNTIELKQPFVSNDNETYMRIKRAHPEIPPVACHLISDSAILDQKLNLLDLAVVKCHMLSEGRLTPFQVKKILNDSDVILKSEPNLLEINTKCFIFGDIHGQFYDLISLLDLFNLNTDVLVFLGDYVDRGQFSVESYLYLMLLKSHYPKNIYILRGNHESEKMTTYFTFKAECLEKYNLDIYDRFVTSFNTLPLAAVIQKKAFCAHGGISPYMKKVAEINNIKRFREVEYNGLFCDLLWSDPHENYDMGMGVSWQRNERRRCSVKYTYRNVKDFLDLNGLSMIIRAHEVQDKGYNLMKHYRGHPSVITIFSAPSYCDAYQNDGAFIEFDMGVVSIKRYKTVSHPFVINGFFDGISWSLPFIAEKLLEFTLSIFAEIDKEAKVEEANELVNKMALMRTEREAIDEFQKDESVGCETLSTMEDDMNFEEAKKKDQENEMKKDDESSTVVTAEISPSLQGESLEKVIKEIDKEKDKRIEPVMGKIEVVHKLDEEKIKIKAPESEKEEPKKSRFCKYFCSN